LVSLAETIELSPEEEQTLKGMVGTALRPIDNMLGNNQEEAPNKSGFSYLWE
jgi:hypothetical protein